MDTIYWIGSNLLNYKLYGYVQFTECKQSFSTTRRNVMKLNEIKLPENVIITYNIARLDRQLAIMNNMMIASIRYSVANKSWFINFYSISNEVYELYTEKECREIIQQKANEFIISCLVEEKE